MNPTLLALWSKGKEISAVLLVLLPLAQAVLVPWIPAPVWVRSVLLGAAVLINSLYAGSQE